MSSANGFVPESVEGPSQNQTFFQAIARFLTNVVVVLYFALEALALKFVPSRLLYKSVSDEIILVTGAGSGIGRLIAIKFASLGAKIVCWDMNKDGVDETVNDIRSKGGIAYAYVCDVSDREIVYASAKAVRQEVGKVCIIINNAGIVFGKRFIDLSDENIEKTFAVNCLAHYWIVKAFLPDMLSANHGHIVSIASLAGQVGVNRLTGYCGSKFAAVGFAESLSLELYQQGYTGIRTTIVCPYFISTGMFHGANGGAFSFLAPEYVTNEIVEGVLLNKDLIILPRYLLPLIALKHWLPNKAAMFANRELGILNSMATFKPSERVKKTL